MNAADIEYIEKLREADRRYYEAEISALRRAVDKYNESNNERWINANEFRAQLKDQAATFLTRKELWLAGVAIIGIVLTIVSLFIHK